jgi:hypothetical protein
MKAPATLKLTAPPIPLDLPIGVPQAAGWAGYAIIWLERINDEPPTEKEIIRECAGTKSNLRNRLQRNSAGAKIHRTTWKAKGYAPIFIRLAGRPARWTVTQSFRDISYPDANRKGIMDRLTYRKILACLHPDRVSDPALKKRYEEAFRLFTNLEKRVLNEKESPTQFRKMPRTYEELMAMKAKVQSERRARRGQHKQQAAVR